MRVRVAREEGDRLEEGLAGLLPVEPNLAYGNFAPIAQRGGGAVGLHLCWWRTAAAGQGVLVARDEQDRPLAMLRLGHRDFESQHFGMPMAKIELPVGVAEEGARLPAMRALYRAASDLLRADGYRHLSAVSSAHDRVTCWVLQELGCFHVGTKISWMASLTGRRETQELSPGLRIEIHERATIPTLSPASWRRLHEWSGTAFDRGPFVFDLNVPADRAAGIYQVWTHKALTGEWADVVLVVYDGTEIVAFNAMLLLKDLSEAAGVGVLGRGLGASLPGYQGLFTALQRECAASRPLGAGFLENETQTATVQSIRVFGKLGHQCLHSVASFHLRLDQAPGPRS